MSGSAHAAGLGRLTVQSALGQPLRAEVEVTSLTRDEVGSVSARLASPDAFRQAGLEFNPALMNLRFAIEQRGNRHFVRITSAQPINEPFVDLLVELNWSSGRFTREYTFLLDPPELKLAREPIEGGPPRVESVVPPVVAPARSAVAAAPSAAAAAPSGASAAPAPSAASAPGAAARTTRSSDRPAQARSGPANGVEVRRGDTLSGIARDAQPPSVTLDQAMIAIYRANPSAFMGNINLLKEGSTLAIPDRAAMAAVDPTDATREVRVQIADFAAYRSRLASAAGTVAPAQRAAGRTAAGSVGARVEEPAAAASAGDQLVLSRPGATGGAPGAAVGSQGSRNAADEQRIARDAALREANSRVADLERNVADLQKLLQLKNQSLADVQKQLEEARNAGRTVTGQVGQVPPVAAAPAPGAAATASRPAAAGNAPGSQPAARPAAGTPAAGTPAAIGTAPASTPSASAPGAVTPAPRLVTPAPGVIGPAPGVGAPTPGIVSPATGSAGPRAASAPAVGPTTVAPVAAAPATGATAPVRPAPRPTTPPAQARGFTDELLENPFLLPGLGGLALLGAGYGWYAMRRRRKVEKFEDSLIAADEFAANSLFGTTGGQSVDTSQAYAGAAAAGLDVHPTEVDPIAEADVYIAYGREAQAEEILREALKRQPARHAIRLKLLEIYSGRRDARAFEAVAREMHDMSGGHNEEWPKVVTLGLSLDPDNPLYGGKDHAAAAGTVPATADGGAPGKADGAGAAGVGIAAAGAAAVGLAAAGGYDHEAGRSSFPDSEFPELRIGDLDSPASQDEPFIGEFPAAAEETPSGELAGLDFDLDLDSRIDAAAAVPDARIGDTVTNRVEPGFGASDLAAALGPNFELPTLELGPEEAADSDEGGLQIDFPSLQSLSGSAADVSAPSGRRPVDLDFDLSPISLDLEPAVMGADEAGATAGSGRWQEMATKLDLASAYEEIGDKEGARELLQEVVSGGDSSQQQKARAMLGKIG